MSAFIGIDLGTTFSVAATIDANGRSVTIPNDIGEPTTPSVVWFGTDPPTVGKEAKLEQKAGASDVESFFKRSMGNPQFLVHYNGKDYTPVDLSALVLAKLKADSEAHLRQKVTEAVITVPAYFTNAARQATIDAGRRAGLDVLCIINEPTAAALAYGVHQTNRNETVMVYDLGGGTFDVTLVRLAPDAITVVATDGDHMLGGKDWDDAVAMFLASRFEEEHGVDPLENQQSRGELLVRCEEAKRTLSRMQKVNVHIDHEGTRATYELTRDKFEELTEALMARTRLLTEQVLKDAGMGWTDLAGVLLVGGSTNMPMVHKYVQAMSGKPPRTGVNVDEAVAQGAAIQAAISKKAKGTGPRHFLTGKKVQDVMSHSLGMIATSPDRSRFINSIIIPKNRPIPSEQTLPFKLRTRANQANTCDVYVMQGESDLPNQCICLGQYRFSGINHDPQGSVVLEVKYAYDHNGVVDVSATDSRSGQPLAMTQVQNPDLSWVENKPEGDWLADKKTIYLVLDISGSMMGGPLEEAKRSALEFRNRCDLSHMSVGVISFGSSARTHVLACQDARRIDAAITGLGIEGSTNMTDGLQQAHGHLRQAEGKKYIVLLTDGSPDNSTSALMEAKSCHADQIEVIAIGTGGANLSYLQQIASSDQHSVFAASGSLVGAFSSIAEAITSGSGPLRLVGR